MWASVHRWALGLVVFVGFSACQWLPVVALLPETTRASMTLRDAAAWSLPWRYLVGLLLADHGGFHEWMTYIGVSTLALAGVGVGALWRKREERWLAGWLVGLLVGAAWFGLGENGGLFQVLYRVVPGLGLLRVPPRSWVLVVFALAVLAGLGVEETRRQGDTGTRRQGGKGTRRLKRRKRRKRALLLAVGMFPPLLVAGYWLLVGAPPLNLVMFGIVTPLAVAILISNFSFRNLHLSGLAAVLLVTVDLWVVDTTLVETRSPEQVFADGRAAAEWLAAQPGHFRVYSPSYSIPQHVAELYGLELADGVDPLQLARYARWMSRSAGLSPWEHPYIQEYSVTLPPFPPGSDVRSGLADAKPDLHRLRSVGVRYIAAAFPMPDEGLQLVGYFDRVYVYRIGPGVDADLHYPKKEADPLARGTELRGFSGWPWYATWYPLEIVTYTPNRVVFRADGMKKVIFHGVWSTGWQARVNGEPYKGVKPFFGSCPFFSWVSIEGISGPIEVTFSYQPWSVYAGWGVSGATLLGLGVWWAVGRRKRCGR